jgi:pseudouridine-5'-phosphate glycosidase
MSDVITIRADVAEALERGRPVVALESTLIAHGLPRPDNLELARDLEDIIRVEGAVPATIGVVGGVATVGLSAAELELMAGSTAIPKLSVRDLPIAIAKGSNGATTVASTAYLAARVGIRLFATGGLGGVHREARDSWDVSADIVTLSRTPVAVVCAGVKSILDIPATLEYLESCGVPVIGFGTRQFPGFYLNDSGYALDWSVDGAAEAARVIDRLPALGLTVTGLVVANPISAAEQLDPALHDRALAMGLDELKQRGIRGKGVTPFLLSYFQYATGGVSLRVNKQIIRNNARLAAQIARELAELTAGRQP